MPYSIKIDNFKITSEVKSVQQESTPASDNYYYFQHETTINTGGGTAVGGGAFQQRPINTELVSRSWVTLSSDQLTISPGTYHVRVICPAYFVDRHKAILWDDTNNVIILEGTSALSDNIAGGDVTNSYVEGVISVTSTTVFDVRHAFQLTRSTDGLGLASNQGSNEVYLKGLIIRLD